MKKAKLYKIISGILLAGFAVMPSAYAYDVNNPPPQYGTNDPGVQLNRMREYMERQRVAQQIAEDRAKEDSKVEGQSTEQEEAPESAVKFVLNDIKIDGSEVLTKEEISGITSPYIGQEVTLQNLYDIVNALNDLYQQKGYLTCRAYLPPQTIKNGVVEIKIIEGKTGNVHIAGNETTREDYIAGRIGLERGSISNINDLNDDLLLFNATNDVQLRITMHAGEEPGTTDYVIAAYEPQKNYINVYVDNAGSESSGEWREGLFWTDRSLTGRRDMLTMSGMRSDGTKSFSAMYSVPVGRSGTKLGLSYSTNSVHITDGELEDLDIKGHSNAYGVSLIQPLVVTENLRTEATLDYGYQNSQTDFLGIHWVDDTVKSYTAGFSMTNYGASSLIYQKHNFRIGDSENIANEEDNFTKYFFNGFWQKAYQGGQMLSARLDAQWSGDDYLTSAEQFYIGGMYSVRGYEESYLGGDSGYSASIEYSVPLDKARTTSAYCFFDYGAVYGDSAFDDHVLAGTGIGIKSTIDRKIYTNLTLGVPLMRDINGEEVSKTRIHFMVNGQF
ncbi:MAG: ShlB/FhaC/HecB family hemolysin secretion/activation protein [Phascolarctobacterium sp.]|nr:MAG: ShlB/FhaC/HecB family hemolysin secretion/activation protein [Phascolarctobacterium sp.]